MKTIYQFVENDTGSALQVECVDNETGNPINLTDKTVWIRFKINSGSLASATMTVINAASGTAQYQFGAGELVAGTLYVSVRIVDNLDSTYVTQLDPFSYRVRSEFT